MNHPIAGNEMKGQAPPFPAAGGTESRDLKHRRFQI